MDNLKPFIDAVNAAADEVQRIASEIYALYEEGSVESKVKALDTAPRAGRGRSRTREAAGSV